MGQSLPMPLEKDLPKCGELIAGRYLIEGTLGSGGMSAVFKVSHHVTKKLFAMKWMLPSLRSDADAVQRFVREAQVAGRVDHQNVVEVYDFGQQAESFFMVMAYLQGESLASRLAAGPLTPAEACTILVPTARGGAAAHAAGVIHRDLKPHNVFLARTSSGEIVPKVLDFGISKLTLLHGDLHEAITREGDIVGTPHYMAPEQVRGQIVDERADVYGLGVILYESLTGELPFPGNSYSDLILKITSQSPQPITIRAPGTPRALVDIVTRAMDRDRTLRFSSVSELADALEQFAGETGYDSQLAYTPTQPGLSNPSPRRTPLSSESRQRAVARSESSGRARFRRHGLRLGASAIALIVIGLTLRGYLQPADSAQGAAARAGSPNVGSMAGAAPAHGSSSPEPGAAQRAETHAPAPAPNEQAAIMPPLAAHPSGDRPAPTAPGTQLSERDALEPTIPQPPLGERPGPNDARSDSVPSPTAKQPVATKARLSPPTAAKPQKRPVQPTKAAPAVASDLPLLATPDEKQAPRVSTRRTRSLSKADF